MRIKYAQEGFEVVEINYYFKNGKKKRKIKKKRKTKKNASELKCIEKISNVDDIVKINLTAN